ncbi:uncharacterized protein LOC116501603 [Aythya fuligula]|uniref:Uncharacterized protein LOC116501603 n=1 Tax=Aythya fuligula TaxID=219594 RepID=A0A6J3EIQ4_AYTFU|nr:uncharacterized protein LOC116501603 [Aythya fuligula]
MEERPPSHPRVAWEESESSDESSSVLEPFEVESQQPDASWLPVYEEEEEAVDFIEAFVKNPEKDDVQKIKFLRNIVTVCTTAKEKGLLEGLDIFCFRNMLAENIQVLLDEEPRDKLCTVVRQQAMLAISALSTVEVVLEDEMMFLLLASFKSVFLLPPKEELDIRLYDTTLKSMDIMLQMLLISPPTFSFTANLCSILQVGSFHSVGFTVAVPHPRAR